MYEWAVEALKIAGLVLSFTLPAIGAYFVYSKREAKDRAAPSIGGAGLQMIGAALLTESTAERMMKTGHELKDTFNRLARAIEVHNESHGRIMDHVCDEMVATRRAIEEVAIAYRRTVDGSRVPGRRK